MRTDSAVMVFGAVAVPTEELKPFRKRLPDNLVNEPSSRELVLESIIVYVVNG
jgi:hypothetical protein